MRMRSLSREGTDGDIASVQSEPAVWVCAYCVSRVLAQNAQEYLIPFIGRIFCTNRRKSMKLSAYRNYLQKLTADDLQNYLFIHTAIAEGAPGASPF